MFIVLYIASHLLLIITLFYLFSPNFLSPQCVLRLSSTMLLREISRTLWKASIRVWFSLSATLRQVRTRT